MKLLDVKRTNELIHKVREFIKQNPLQSNYLTDKDILEKISNGVIFKSLAGKKVISTSILTSKKSEYYYPSTRFIGNCINIPISKIKTTIINDDTTIILYLGKEEILVTYYMRFLLRKKLKFYEIFNAKNSK